MSTDHPRAHFGIRSKILFFGLLPTLIVMGIVIFRMIGDMRQHLLDTRKNNIKLETMNVALRIERSNLESTVIPKVMALAQEAGMFGKRDESTTFAKMVLEAFPNLTGAYFGYEPNADNGDQGWMELLGTERWPGSINEQGRYLPYWHVRTETMQQQGIQSPTIVETADSRKLGLEPLVDMEISYYYQGTKNRVEGRPETDGIKMSLTNREGEAVGELKLSSSLYDPSRSADKANEVTVTEPYIYRGKTIVEQAAAIVIDGQFKGIAGADRALDDIEAELDKQKPFDSSDFFLLSKRGRVIAATINKEFPYQETKDGGLKLKPGVIETLIVEEAEPFDKLLAKAYQQTEPIDLVLLQDPELKKPFYYAIAKIDTGDWTLIMRVAEAEVMQEVNTTIRAVAIIATIGTILVVLIMFWLADTISRRIRSASDAAARVASGDLTVEVTASGNDETGTLLSAIRSMVASLNGLLSKVKQSSIQVMSTATKLNATSTQQERVVSDFGASTTQIAAAVKEISATSHQLLKTMDDVKHMVEGTAGLANDGRSRLSGMEGAMRSLADATASISEKLSVISEKANNIGSVVTAITKVADQTNLLSLNAAIEAEKAGEYGLGFAVVAREIRRLADQTAVATLDIEQMVKEMQGSVSSGVMEIDRFTDEVRRGVKETVDTSEQFSRILEQVQSLTPRFEVVHEGMQSQSQGAEQIAQAMGNLSDAAKQSAGSLHELKNASSSLQSAVNELKEEVSRFQVR